ncbi:YciI family protein [Microlunatus soli]|uniref:YCII-related domain-containing protein n=1 Tax=Microlunatus soli TaxID=630515 RepID=A0A1H1U184_9ACTN|nr:YciI family protein [Microlunatus soli]SDS66153.1 YCII-related domain-containing protein [Microlunatus soli]
MAEYLIFFNQQWVGDHPDDWWATRIAPSMAVVEEMKAAGVYVFAGGLEEDPEDAYSADATSGEVVITDGPFVETKEFLGGFTVIDVPDDETATMWAGKVAVGCGWPQEVRRFKPVPEPPTGGG